MSFNELCKMMEAFAESQVQDTLREMKGRGQWRGVTANRATFFGGVVLAFALIFIVRLKDANTNQVKGHETKSYLNCFFKLFYLNIV